MQAIVDARAFIQGWNDVIEAATRENGKPLTAHQQARVLLNLRYRAVFLAPLSERRIAATPSGTIEPTDRHVLAIVQRLGEMNVLDIGIAIGS